MPIPVVVLICLAVIAGVWRYGTREVDFLTPPTAAELAEARQRVESSLPQAGQPANAVATPPPVLVQPKVPPPEERAPKVVLALGDLSRPPELYEYAPAALRGAEPMADLAARLEAKGEPVRALLAWERVLDTARADAGQAAAAIAAIQRLRPKVPAWNKERKAALAVTLQVTSSKRNASALKPVAAQVAREVEEAAGGLLRVTAQVTAGRKNGSARGQTPVAVTFTGGKKTGPATQMMLVTPESNDTLHRDLLKTVFLLVRESLAKSPGRPPPVQLAADTPPLTALQSHITRLQWQEFASRLNPPPKKDE